MIAAHLAVPRRTALRAVEVDFRDRRWAEFIASHPDALIYHHPGWLAALESEYGQRCLSLACEDEHSNLTAVLPLFYTRGLGMKFGPLATGRRLSSLPRTPVAGPLALNQESAAAVIEYAVELARRQQGVQLEIKSDIACLDKAVDGLTCVPWRPTYVEELPPLVDRNSWEQFWESLRLPRPCLSCEGCRRLRFGNSRRQHRVHWSVNKAIKMGLTVRDAETAADLKKWYRLYLLTMRENAVPPRPYRLFQNLWNSLHSTRMMRLLLAVEKKSGHERMVAGSIFLQFGQTVFYAFTGCAPEDFRLHPHDIIQMEAIRGACKAGFRWYDFGEVAEEAEALTQFKTKWGGNPKPLYRYYFPAPVQHTAQGGAKLMSSVRKVWKSLPPRATEVLGDLIYGRM